MARKVLIIGLDSASPQLVFDQFTSELPCLSMMMERGIYGELRSCHPPITIPAWMVMTTGKSPGTLGLYGFRHRKGYSYSDGWIATSQAVNEPTLWDILSAKGKEVCLVGVPPSYPPKPVKGCLLSCFITPDAAKTYTHPPGLKQEIEQLVGEYIFDVEFRHEDRDGLLEKLYEMTEKRFKVVQYLLTKKSWDFFMWVEIGLDRVHHAFWKYFDPEHEKYQPGNKYEAVVKNYYQFLDKGIGETLSLIDQDTVVLVVSDHGTKGMRGAFCVNQWLEEEDYLVLKQKPNEIISLEKAEIDWERTKAWGWGGYYARIFLNVKGREAQGVIEPEDYDRERDKLAEKLKSIKDPKGRVMDTKVYKPEELYEECRGNSPDLMVYFDDLYWRSAGTMGYDTLYLSENDTGPDDAVHDYNGIFILYDPRRNWGRRLSERNILDITPTVLRLMDIPKPEDMAGEAIKIKEESGQQ